MANTKTYQFTQVGADVNATVLRRQDGDARYASISSDERLKENIADMGDVGALIDVLRPVRYTWKSDETDPKPTGVQYGLVAQEVDTVAPEISRGSEETNMGVDPLSLIGVLIKEVQSLRARVAELEG